MKARAVQWRAVALPASVALAATLALVWFNFVHVPRTERYLNERNFRQLRTIGAQIKSKVDNLDQALDNALESLDADSVKHFSDYVPLFASDIEILKFLPSDSTARLDSAVQDRVLRAAGDPPRIMIERDEGRSFLYLGFRRDGHKVLAKIDLDKLLADYFPAQNDFDALLLVGSAGRVIVKRPANGIDLARVDQLSTTPAAPAPAAKDGGSKADDRFESFRTMSTLRIVPLGDTRYQLYVQPVQLSLPSVPDKDTDALVPEEWTLCGLVATDRFHAAGAAISYTAMLWFAAALAAICLAIPLLKLQMLHARERLRRTDGVVAAATSFLAVAACAIALLDLYRFGVEWPRAIDARLAQAADRIANSLKNEVDAIDRQMSALQRPETWRRDLGYDQPNGDHLDFAAYRAQLRDAAKYLDPPKIVWKDGSWTCQPTWACRQQVLAALPPERIRAMPYPYFALSGWNDLAGWQRIKWTTSPGVTPLINANGTLPYFAAMKQARLLADPSAARPPIGVSVFLSPNTGNRVTVFWKAIIDDLPAKAEAGARARGSDLVGQSMATNPLSLDRPVLPDGMQFAVINRSGLVLFHSDTSRSLKENFIEECEDSLALKSLLARERPGALSANYRARPHALFVEPLDLGSFGKPEWSLIVFQDKNIPDTINLYTVVLAVALFAAYAIALALGWAAAWLLFRESRSRWLWPDPKKCHAYRAMAAVNGALAAMAIAGLYVRGPTASAILTAITVVAALAASYTILAGARESTAERGVWPRDFLLARTSLLVALAAVPALVCFQAAYMSETELARRGDEVRLRADTQRREAQMRRQASPAALCGRDYEHGQPCPNLTAFVEKRKADELSWSRAPATAAAAAESDRQSERDGLMSFLQTLHVPINNFSVALSSVAATDDAGSQTRSILWSLLAFILWPIALATSLVACAYLLSRYVARRLLGLSLSRPMPPRDEEPFDDFAANLLLVGPPGSGKSARLRGAANVRIFDVRALACVERRKRICPVPIDRRVSAGAPGAFAIAALGAASAPLGPIQPSPSDWTTEITSTPESAIGVIGIDHLEYRLDDPKFRDPFLRTLEDLLFHQERRVWIASACEPLQRLREIAARRQNGNGHDSAASDADAIDLDRWTRVLQSFRAEVAALSRESMPGRLRSLDSALVERQVAEPTRRLIRDECALSPQLQAIAEDIVRRFSTRRGWTDPDVRHEIGDGAEPYYRALWSTCSNDEKLTLVHLAEEGLVNLHNHPTVRELMRKGLVVSRGGFHLMNETFRRFVAHAVPAETIAVWERDGVTMPWTSVRTALVTFATALTAFLILTQQQLVGAWSGALPAILPAVVAPAVPQMINLLIGRVTKKESALA